LLPSLVTRDIQFGLRQYLLSAYEASDDFFGGIMLRFLERDGSWLKGPYVQLGLPFHQGAKGRRFFDDFETMFPGYVHQEQAWTRLQAAGATGNTIIATGTGSGKTECFLYPILEHCARQRKAGKPGVKALIIYPMNALATDQARRLAETIHAVPAFRGLRAGIYVRQNSRRSSGLVASSVMTPAGLITDRDEMRKSPPDILLTNYKMLDYLLIRPEDRRLWERNDPDTLRYVVVDELHTFDGAQGTDLALLLRRLKARLKADSDVLTYVGTSATLGSLADTTLLQDYARQIFGSVFDSRSVITESRHASDEFLGGATIEFQLPYRNDLHQRLSPSHYPGPDAVVKAVFPIFFPGLPEPDDVADGTWRSVLGGLLKQHVLFVELVRALDEGVLTFSQLAEKLSGQVTAAARAGLPAIVDALLALIAWARSPESADMPLVTVRTQMWIRELRRMVVPLKVDPLQLEMLAVADLGVQHEKVHLPIVQCRECHTTAWLSRTANSQDSQLIFDLEQIYNAWFGRSTDVVRLYPGLDPSNARTVGLVQFACCDCGNLNSKEKDCRKCGSDTLVPVFRPTDEITRKRGNQTHRYHDPTCPVCGGPDDILLVGSRSTTLAAMTVEHSWSCQFNDDRKLIAFSDSVQDAAHRAGFITARTYNRGLRTAIAHAVNLLAPTRERKWSEMRRAFESVWFDEASSLKMDPGEFVSKFIGPNMTWQAYWTRLYDDGATLLATSPLIKRVRDRLNWHFLAEFTYAGNRGRTLDRLGVATLAPALPEMEFAAVATRSMLSEKFGQEHELDVVRQWLWGFVIRLRRLGALHDRQMGDYAADGDLFAISKKAGRELWMPAMGPRTQHPEFMLFGSRRGYDRLATGASRGWYDRWLSANLAQSAVLQQDVVEIYRAAALLLSEQGIVRLLKTQYGTVVGLDPDKLTIYTRVRRLVTVNGSHGLSVPKEVAHQLDTMPCLDDFNQTYHRSEEPAAAVRATYSLGQLQRVIGAEHTGLLEQDRREQLERRFKSRSPMPWYENLLSATPTLEMGVDIGDLSSVLICGVPPSVASFMQRVGRAGRRDGNACVNTVADGTSSHDQYYYAEPEGMIHGEIRPPGVFLKAPEVLRRQFCAFSLDNWVAEVTDVNALPKKTDAVLNAVDRTNLDRFPYTFLDFIQRHSTALLEEFMRLLGDDSDRDVEARLRRHVEGDEEITSLRLRFMETFEALCKERKNYTDRAKELKNAIALKKRLPEDEATTNEINELTREREGLLELAGAINQRELLETLTDDGLLPNYAFPEAGVKLTSILWRKSIVDDGTTSKYLVLPPFNYERPASSALSEFAPENRFYANQRRVKINQINMALAKEEVWRLCANCQHMEKLGPSADSQLACPRCLDTQWADAGQKRTLLRFRQAISNNEDTGVRIDDSAEDREPRFYLRQLLVDFTPAQVREAWMLQGNTPFGFEFIVSATFRDINFGEKGKQGDRFKVADRDANRAGFRLCKQCGMVQTPPKPSSDENDELQQTHDLTCPMRGKSDDESIITCLYLYREFSSEALRILVPYTSEGLADSAIHSFSAAIQLGLKQKYGGQVNHLQIAVQEMPDAAGGPRRKYLLLYDTVPGGTGYLAQLLAHDAATLKDVFRMALNVISRCTCAEDPNKDGCYACVYQYRMRYEMTEVSRRTALELMEQVVEALDRLERVDNISELGFSQALDSYLEKRFIRSLEKLSGENGLPPVNLVQEIVNGRLGYHLQVGENRYAIEKQAYLGAEQGVRRPSIPDFLIRPITPGLKRKPIAVFCDGWSFHKDIIRDDAIKRSAIQLSGAYWVWSVVMNDVEKALTGNTERVLPLPFGCKTNHEIQPNNCAPSEIGTFTRNSVAELIRWLSLPCRESDVWVEQAWLASMNWLARLAVPPSAGRATASENESFRRQLPDLLTTSTHNPATTLEVGLLGEDQLFDIRGRWDGGLHARRQTSAACPALIIFDDERDAPDEELHIAWRWWLAAFNWLQTIPGTILVTHASLESRDFDIFYSAPSDAHIPVPPTGQVDPLWSEALGQIVCDLRPEAKRLCDSGLSAPDAVGYSLVSDGDEELSMAEIVWFDRRVAVLVGEYWNDKSIWIANAWRVVHGIGEWSHEVLSLTKSGD
jgi:DEAD/DEAH box helicase domain-containing protein